MSDVTDFISAAVQNKPVAAAKAFSAAMEPKIHAAIDARYDEMAQGVFNQADAVEDESTEIETEMGETDVE